LALPSREPFSREGCILDQNIGATAELPEDAKMRTSHVFLALTMITACGGAEGPVLYQPNDAALGGNTGAGGSLPGTGGSAAGTGGTASGAGGTSTGSGGASVGAGGAVPGTGGATVGAGGAAVGTGGTVVGTGGASIGAGGASIGTGGAVGGRGGATGSGGSMVGTGGFVVGTGGTAGARGGATGVGGSVVGTGGSSLGRGGAAGGGSGGTTPDGGTPCSSWTNSTDCWNAGCNPLNGIMGGVSEAVTFWGCIGGACTGVVTAASPADQPANCYVFSSGCIPDGWKAVGGSKCPTGRPILTITSVNALLDCMPGVSTGADRLSVMFDVKYDNTNESNASVATIKSASLSFAGSTLRAISFPVDPPDSGVIRAGQSLVVTHTKDPNSQSGLSCPCNSSPSVTLDVTWEVGGQIAKQTVNSSFGPTTLMCGN
jgi:hypothetical protein